MNVSSNHMDITGSIAIKDWSDEQMKCAANCGKQALGKSLSIE